MNELTKTWLSAVPWDSVLTLNQALCQAQKVTYEAHAKKLEKIRLKWDQAAPKAMALVDVLTFLRQCQDERPFVFNNGNTFAAIAKTLVEDRLKVLSPLEAQIMRTTVCHYVAGQVGRKELAQVLGHFAEACWRAEAPQPQPVMGSHTQPQGAA